MSTPAPGFGSFAFVPWLRRGVGLHLGAAAAAQTPVSVAFQVGGRAISSPPLALHGPGDIVGFDPAAICRVWPSTGATNAEPDYLALIEFDQADLPWRFTPSEPSGDQLAPWLCLIVATEVEFSSLVPGSADRPLGTVTINAAAALPDLTHSYAWAHAEGIGETSLAGASAASLMQGSPQLIRSRILCPRVLAPNTAYTAFLVPTLELGRLGGLLTPDSAVAMSTPAWSTVPVTLPVYYTWTFSTGDPGDFSILIRELTANPLPDAVALRDMDVGDVSGGSAPIGIGGSLTTAAHPTKDLPAADQLKVTSRYASALAPSPPAVRPPLYGNAYVGTTEAAWYSDLNHDPRTRAAAGLGAQVVREHSDALLAGAWSQAEGLREANQQLRQWEMSRELARSLWARHAPTNSPDDFLAFVSPIASRVSTGTTTMAESVKGSTIPDGALSPALRKLTRPLGPLALRQKRAAAPALLTKLSDGAWLGGAAIQVQPAPGAPAKTGAVVTTTVVKSTTAVSAVVSARFSQARLGEATGLFGTGDPVTTLKAAGDKTGLADAAATLFQQLGAAPTPGIVLQALNLPTFQKSVASQADPAAAIDAEVRSRAIRDDGRSGAAPFVVAPSFSQAMSQWLSGVAQEWLLPGLSHVPANTVSLLAADRRFLEAFMAGLNHEMGSRLIFDEYPTDLRATFFKSFWSQGADDIAPVNVWGTLGNNPPAGSFSGDPMVLLIRGDLVRRYPNMQVLAVQATAAAPQRTLGTIETAILFSGHMDPDVAFYGFPLTAVQALGTATTPGYYFVIQEHPSEPRFGGSMPAGSSAAVAAALLQHPVRLAIYAADLLTAPAAGGS
ncbi:hypothetical protein [Candidatus Binatus sp.]|uniref:hypothetical protein n=1 Tax=Candidatus Binatus sp. TaxID=2811406 RepID=UPI003CC5C6DF